MADATDRLSLSVLVATRHRFSSLDDLVSAMLPQVRAVGGELVVVSGAEHRQAEAPAGARFVAMPGELDIMQLRARALAEANGAVIAIGEDHSYPTPGWTDAAVRAHAEQPDVPVIIGCLVNGTTGTAAARANFLAFASPFTQPMLEVPRRPPPVSVVTIKREALADGDRAPGVFETELIPRLHTEGRIRTDDRMLVEHRQPFGVMQAMRNGFSVARASYGYAQPGLSRSERRRVARWALANIAPRTLREARRGRARVGGPRRDLVIVAMIAVCTTLGAIVGAIRGPGAAALHSA
jgi:hypothetical protein